jgi:hypothetical protein
MNQRIRKTFFAILAVLVLLSPTIFAEPILAQTTIQTVRILADGTVDPASAPIQRFGDRYVLTSNINGVIIVERENIELDGAGYTLQGTYNGTRAEGWMIGQGPPQESDNTSLWTIGIDLYAATKPNNVTVKNVNIEGFYVGMYIYTKNNRVEGNSVNGNIIGVLLSGDSNTLDGNYIANNDEGLFLGINNPGDLPIEIVLTRNSFVDNKVQLSGCTCEEYNISEPVHAWDNGSIGNFWSDYNGTDKNGDGIGDSPYFIDLLNLDRYPLIQAYSTPALKPTTTSSPNRDFVAPIGEIGITIAVGATVIAAVAVLLRKRKRIENS